MLAFASQSDLAHFQLLAVRLPWPHRALAQAMGRLPRAASGACPSHRALAPGHIGRLPRPHRGAPPVSIYAALTGRTPRPHRAHSRYLCKLRDWAHSQSYAAVFQLYAISGRAHFRHRPMQLRAVHRGWAHSHPFGGNVSTFNTNATSQASTRFWSGPMAIAGILPKIFLI